MTQNFFLKPGFCNCHVLSKPEILWRPLNFHKCNNSLRDRVIFTSIVLGFLNLLNLARFAESCHRSPRVSKVTRGFGLKLSIFDRNINRHNLYIIGVDSTMWIHRRLRWLRWVINDPIWAVSATRPMVPSNWWFEVNQTVMAVTCAPAHWTTQCRQRLIVYDNLPPSCLKEKLGYTSCNLLILNKKLMQTGAARCVDVDQATRGGRKRWPQHQRRLK